MCCLADIQSSETFRVNGGPKMVVDILRNGSEDSEILNSCFAIVTASATGNEVVKESFMELKIDELVLEVLSRQRNDRIQNLYYAMRVLLTADDDRVVASQVSKGLIEMHVDLCITKIKLNDGLRSCKHFNAYLYVFFFLILVDSETFVRPVKPHLLDWVVLS